MKKHKYSILLRQMQTNCNKLSDYAEKYFGKKLKELRATKKLTQATLAKETGHYFTPL